MTLRPTATKSLVLTVILLAATTAARGQTATGIRDDANFFSPQGEAKAADAIRRIEQRHGTRVVVETYPSIPREVLSEFGQPTNRTQFYERWMVRRGRQTGGDVFLLITREPRWAQIGASEKTRQSGAFTTQDFVQANERLIAAFKQQQFDQGLLQAVEFIDRRLGENTGPERTDRATGAAGAQQPGASRGGTGGTSTYPPPAGSTGGSNAPAPTPSRQGGGISFGSILCVLVAIIGAFILIRAMTRRRAAAAPGGYGYGQTPGAPPPPLPGGGYGPGGYGSGQDPRYGGGMGGGGFGRGVAGGLLGGLLGSWMFGRMSHGAGMGGALGGGADPNAAAGGHPAGLPPTDPSALDGGGYASTGGDWGGGGAFSGGSDAGGGGGIDVSDSGGSAGGEF